MPETRKEQQNRLSPQILLLIRTTTGRKKRKQRI